MVNDHLDLLGLKVSDIITGTEGIVDSVCFDLYGCVQAAINTGLDKDGKRMENHWFDVKRLRVLSGVPVMDRPDFGLPEAGPADKPARNT